MGNVPYEELEPGVVPIVRYFNEYGLPTRMSCEGHPGTNMRLFWVEFEPSVTEEQIRSFMEERTDDDNGFTAMGWFVERLENYKEGSRAIPLSCMCYVAADKEAAAGDLKSWQERERNGRLYDR